MQTSIIQADVRATSGKLVLSMASTPEELREVQRLRYKVFIETMGLSSLVREDGLDLLLQLRDHVRPDARWARRSSTETQRTSSTGRAADTDHLVTSRNHVARESASARAPS